MPTIANKVLSQNKATGLVVLMHCGDFVSRELLDVCGKSIRQRTDKYIGGLA